MLRSRFTRFSRSLLLLAAVTAVAACSGTHSANPPVPAGAPLERAAEHGARRAPATVSIPSRYALGQHNAIHRRKPAIVPIADEALQIGDAYPNRESWAVDQTTYPLDPSCVSLNWTYANTIPGVTVTVNPVNTSLTGSTVVSFTTIPTGTAISVWTQTITPTCTGSDPTGNLPVATNYTIATVTLDIGRVPQVPAAPAIITNATATPIVGQFIELQATPQPKVTFVKVKWGAIPGDTVKTYTQTKDKASFTMLSPGDLEKTLVDFYWIHGSAGNALPLTLSAVFPVFNSHCLHSCTGSEDYWGQTNAQASANVLAPTGVTLTSVTGSVLANKYEAACGYWLHYGAINTSCGNVAKAGIDWTMDATAPAGGAGELDATQLIDRQDVAGPFPGVSPAPTAFPGTKGFELDTCIHYGNQSNAHTPVAAGAGATYKSNDSPGFGLANAWRLFTAMDRFTIEFVYRPTDQAGAPAERLNIWAPLGHLDWNWKGSAKNTGTPPLLRGMQPLDAQARAPSWWNPASPAQAPDAAHPNWSLTSDHNAVDPRGVAGNDPLPTWTKLYSPSVQPCPPGG